MKIALEFLYAKLPVSYVYLKISNKHRNEERPSSQFQKFCHKRLFKRTANNFGANTDSNEHVEYTSAATFGQ